MLIANASPIASGSWVLRTGEAVLSSIYVNLALGYAFMLEWPQCHTVPLASIGIHWHPLASIGIHWLFDLMAGTFAIARSPVRSKLAGAFENRAITRGYRCRADRLADDYRVTR